MKKLVLCVATFLTFIIYGNKTYANVQSFRFDTSVVQNESNVNTREDNLKAAQSYMDGMIGGRLDVIDSVMAKDVIYTVISDINESSRSPLPWIGTYHGRQAVKAYLTTLGHIQKTTINVEKWISDNNTVVAFAILDGQSFATKKSGKWEVAFRFDFKDGKISRHFLYEDSYAAAMVHIK